MIAKFKAAKTMLLCATDVAQRGLDVKGVSQGATDRGFRGLT